MSLHIQHEAELPAMQQGVPLQPYCGFYFDGGIVVAGAKYCAPTFNALSDSDF
ncbi:MAG: hypothetical protein PUE25_07350 [bacterium]|nr:hypothetical protein [bacterium]